MYRKLAALELEVTGYELEPLELATSGGWTRKTTVVRLRGRGHEGVGEDVTYQDGDQVRFRREGRGLPLAISGTLDDFSTRLDEVEMFASPPEERSSRLYRRWAFESAALDLALRQSGLSLAGALGRKPAPISFAVSLGLGNPPSTERMRSILALHPGMRFKVDLAENWTAQTVAELAEFGAVAVVDLKGQYHGAFSGPAADPEQYRQVAEGLPDAWLEDPAWNDETRMVLEPHRERITWDAILHSFADIEQLPFPPRCVNIKPSRFGLVSELMRVYDYCERRGIAMYGGGQFELGAGRGQIQLLASLFHAAADNDVAPSEFNSAELSNNLPGSPLEPKQAPLGFRRE